MTRRFTRFLRRNTIALLALFIALSGTTFAATNALAPNSVGAKQLKKNAVTTKKIKKNAVTGAKVKNNSITGADVLESSLGKVPSATNADTAANTNALNGYAANGLVRVARANGAIFPSGSAALGACESAYTSLATVTITAPGPGFVKVDGVYTARHVAAGDTVEAQLIATGGATSPIEYGVAGTSAGQMALVPFGNSWVFPVSAAGPFSITLRGCSFATGADAFNAEMSAIFVPFGSSGTSTLSVAKLPALNGAVNPAQP
jgi:hypothetical protein